VLDCFEFQFHNIYPCDLVELVNTYKVLWVYGGVK